MSEVEYLTVWKYKLVSGKEVLKNKPPHSIDLIFNKDYVDFDVIPDMELPREEFELLVTGGTLWLS